MAAPDPSQLAGLDLFEAADPRQLEELSRRLELIEIGSGETLGVEGEIGDTFWLILRGEIDIVRGAGKGSTRVARVGSGTIVGELAVLRGLPRTATVTTATPAVVASGYVEALQHLLEIPAARERVRRLVSSRLAQALTPVEVPLAEGTVVLVRPLLPSDRSTYGDEIHHLSKGSLRRRFFSASPPSESLLDHLVDIDYVNHFAWVVLDAAGDMGLGTARYVRTGRPGQAEMAYEIADEYQGRGIGTFLFGALGIAAVQAGISDLRAFTQEDNLAMLKVFAKAGSRTAFGEQGEVVVDADPERAARLVAEPLRHRLAEAVHDVVTAASLPAGPRPI
jgi:CRP-like cAMP-binding protein